MAVVASAAENATDLMGKLSLDTENRDTPDVTKKFGSVDGKEAPTLSSAPSERSLTPLLQEYMDSSMCYVPNGYPSTAYYYGGYDGSVGEWDDYHRYVNHDGVEMPPGVYGDMYHGYGYAPYGTYPSLGSPVPTMGHDGQLYGPQHYQYPATYYQPQAPQNAHYTLNQPPAQGEVSTSTAAEQPPIPVDAAKAKSNGFANGKANSNNGSAPAKTIQQNPSLTSNGSTGRGVISSVHPSSGYQDPIFGFDGIRSPVPWFEPSVIPDGHQRQSVNGTISSAPSHISNSPPTRNQNLRPLPHLMGLNSSRPTPGMGPTAPGLVNRMYSNNRMYTQSGNALRTGLGFVSTFYDSRTSPRWGVAFDSKYKPRGSGNGFHGYGNENFDGLSELNRGPRGGRFRNQKGFGSTVTVTLKGHNPSAEGNVDDLNVFPDKEQLNPVDFPEKYLDAKFFVIKSYSEDDVHKSIKYNVWASTPSGNKKLDDAYRESQEKNACPIFLFFSVNTSGQFVGVAEMTGPVDFNKTVDYWQQDKWTGCFSVKWHIVKDVPNNTLKHITLENNDNKPVTNSRDTQEVKLDQGLQMLKLFKEHVSKTSILDDFHFYETRQKAMLEKRARQQQIQKQVADGRPSNLIEDKNKDGATGKPILQKPLEFVSGLKKDAATGGLAERKPSNENAVFTVAGDTPMVTKPVAEKRVLVNGVSNGC